MGDKFVTQDELRTLKDELKKMGLVFVTEHQTQAGIIERENKLHPYEIHERDWGFLVRAKVGIFEISNPSLGVGAEISDMLNMGKPVICLYSSKVDDNSVSAYILGKAGSKYITVPFECYPYCGIEDAKMLVLSFIGELVRKEVIVR